MLLLLHLTLTAVVAQAETPPPFERRIETHVTIIEDGPGRPGGMDADKDGFVSREEFAAPMMRAFDEMDADHDGRLSTAELEAGGPPPPRHHGVHGADGPPPPPPPPGANGDRRIERRVEIRRFGGPGGGPHGDLDKDGDGKVSEAEFLAPMRDAFRRMDADGSGSLEAGERRPVEDVEIERRGEP